MEEQKHKLTCPACGESFQAESEDEFVKQVQAHAKDHHGMDLPRQQVLAMERSQSGS